MPRERVENTLPAFLLALERGADGVELDAHVTQDGVVVVHHDETVRGRPIAATPWLDLERSIVGADSRIPRLVDVLEAIGTRAAVYVELKGKNIEGAVIAVARAHGHRIALHSFDHDAMARAAAAAADLPRGVLLDRDTPRAAAALRVAAERIAPRDVWPHWTLVDVPFMRAARDLGARVIPWTVNAPDAARRLIALGVDGICTDDVGLLANL